ncbi:unnamed protein product [Leptidea sinapis]|uniref:MTP large subunit lipid-binding domain-containing protein n=1 Tax=Leptidea sinapis TaxID=189913 RepID=A0A5E4QGH2_9NEOP|nr:unnamed protein product [Leptidea sinapis]
MPHAALLAPARFARLERLSLGARDLPARAAALDLLLRLSADAPHGLPPLLEAVVARGDPELRRVLWQRLEALAVEHPESARLLTRLRALRASADWWRMDAGTSSVLTRHAGKAGALEGWRAQLDSVQVARGGLLRRGLVRLTAARPGLPPDDTLSVELQTSGLESFSGGEGEVESGEAASEVRGVLALNVGGVRLPAITLFDGQAELLSQVWAGAGSTPTAVVRALRRLAAAEGGLRLADGAPLRARRRAAVALALDAHATVSLWSRHARAALELRVAAAVHCELAVRTAAGELSARLALELEPRLRIATDVDFYDRVAVCVRARSDALDSRANVTLTSSLGRDSRRVRRVRHYAWVGAGRTLSLGALNDRACCTLVSADD